MLLGRIVQTLLALGATSAVSSVGAAALEERAPRSIKLQSTQFSLFAAAYGANVFGPPGNPFLQWNTLVNISQFDVLSGCNVEFDFPKDQPGGDFCSPVPSIIGFKTTSCDSNNGVSWSITRYGKNYVQQINYQRAPGTVYVACYEFSQSQFVCNKNDNHGNSATFFPPEDKDPPYTQTFVATLGAKCPTS